MKQKARNGVAAAILLGGFVAALVLVGPALRAAHVSCKTYNTFSAAVRKQDWQVATSLFASVNTNWIRIENSRIMSWGRDITDAAASVRPDFFRTFEYYLTDPHSDSHDNVKFPDGSGFSHAGIKDGKVTSIKKL